MHHWDLNCVFCWVLCEEHYDCSLQQNSESCREDSTKSKITITSLIASKSRKVTCIRMLSSALHQVQGTAYLSRETGRDSPKISSSREYTSNIGGRENYLPNGWDCGKQQTHSREAARKYIWPRESTARKASKQQAPIQLQLTF